MENKLKISGLGNLVLVGQEKIEPEKEYLISIKAELKKIEKNIEDKEEPFYTFICEYLSTEQVLEIGSSKKVKVERGKTQSQAQRSIIEAIGRNKGLDPKEYYKERMSKNIEELGLELDEQD